jgi:TRAP-type mannitol/chloroaromatic compound transport system substrate-binding protein
VNKKAWDKLPDDLKAAFKTWIFELDARFDYMSTAESLKALKKMKEAGIEQTQLSDADMKKAKQLSLEVALDWKKKSPMSEKMIDSIISYLKLKGSLQ